MATLATLADIQEYEPDILDFGIPDFDNELSKAQADVFRDLRIKWWPTQTYGQYDIRILGGGTLEPDEDMYNASQLTRATVYMALGYHIYPKLSTFTEEVDIFERKMAFYRDEYAREFDLIVRDGVEYDFDSSGTITETEREPTQFLRLKR